MNFNKPTVALLFGGRGFEHGVSVEGAKFVYPKIDGALYKKIPIFVSKQGDWLIPKEKEATPEALSLGKCEAVRVFPGVKKGLGGLETENGFIPVSAAIPLIHGDLGEDGVIGGALENAKIPYVGCDTATSAILSDKAYTKCAAERLGIKTAPWIYSLNENSESAKERAENELGYPMFIKPARLGSSVGAGAVASEKDFSSVFDKAFSVGGGRVIIEKRIPIKKELECAYFGTKNKHLFTSVGEISSKNDFYDYESKYSADSSARVLDNAQISSPTALLVRDLSRKLTGFFGVRDMCRIDFFLSEDRDIFFNEINTIPGFTQNSLYPRLLMRSGISVCEALSAFIESALTRGA